MKKQRYDDIVRRIDKEKYNQYRRPRWGKVCPMCYKEDIEKYGEPYLHVEHQLPENLVCYKHRMDLTEIKDSNVSGRPVELVLLPHKKLKEEYFYEDEFYYDASKMIHKIFNEHIIGNMYLEEAQEKYKCKLRDKGYYMKTLLNRKKLVSDMRQCFGEDVLKNVGAEIVGEFGWVSSIVGIQKYKLRLICHLVLIRFLFGTIEEFVEYEIKGEPFGEGPWPCLNPFCSEYKIDVIQEIRIRRNKDRGTVRGTWCCPKCGFRYTREGPDKTEEDKYCISSVKYYGEVFDDKVIEVCKDTTLNVKQIADILKCDVKSAKGHMKRVGVPISRHSEEREYDTEEATLERNKEKFKRILEENPNITLRKLNTIHGYRLLREKAPKFCEEYFPKPHLFVAGKRGFEDRDRELSIQIDEIALGILEGNTPKRLTRHFFSETIGYEGIKKKAMVEKMPLTKVALKKWCETIEDYRKRRSKNNIC